MRSAEEQPYQSGTGDMSRRHRQIMDVLYEIGEGSAEEIRARMPAAPSNSAVRATLKIMEDRGLVLRKEKDFRYVYIPSGTLEETRQSAIERLLRLFFNNSAEQAVVALLGAAKEGMTTEQLGRVRELIEQAKRKEEGE
jgi:predicted transcriptional regulator